MVKLHYRKYGSGPPLIILHGLFGSSDNWHTLAKRWGTSFTVYALDQRNHGSSPHESAMDYTEMAQDLDQFIEQQRLGMVYIVGHSMGGKVALLQASLHPDKVAGLVILDIGVGRVAGQHLAILGALKTMDPGDYSSRQEIQEALETFIKIAPIRQFLLKNIMRRVDDSFAWKFNHSALIEHYEDLIAALDLQDLFMGSVLFLRGADSSYLDPDLTPDILQYFPLAQLATIEHAGHWLHAEQPDQVFSSVQDFFIGGPFS